MEAVAEEVLETKSFLKNEFKAREKYLSGVQFRDRKSKNSLKKIPLIENCHHERRNADGR